MQNFHAGGKTGSPSTFISTTEIGAAFGASPQGLERAAELANVHKPTELDMQKLEREK
jgi:hypothetical protein